MHDIYMSVLGLADNLKGRVLKSSPQMKAPGITPRAKARRTQDGRRGLRDSGGGAVGVERIGSDRKPETFSLTRARRTSRKVLKL